MKNDESMRPEHEWPADTRNWMRDFEALEKKYPECFWAAWGPSDFNRLVGRRLTRKECVSLVTVMKSGFAPGEHEWAFVKDSWERITGQPMDDDEWRERMDTSAPDDYDYDSGDKGG